MDGYRDSVVRALVAGYGSLEALFSRLLLTLRPDPSHESQLDEDPFEGVLSATSNALAYNWLSRGGRVIARWGHDGHEY